MASRLGQLGLLIVPLVAGVLPARALAADFPDLQSPPFLVRSWQTEQGLPHNMITAIAQTREGYLWLGTAHGLARFDGVRCRVFGLQDGLRALEISALLQDSRGALWIGTIGGGLSCYLHGRIQTVSAADGLVGDSINALLEDAAGELWVGMTTGLYRRQNGRFRPAGDRLDSMYIRALAKDRQNDVWVSTLHDGLLRFQDERFAAVPGPPEMRTVGAYQLLVDNQNRLWAGLQSGVILRRDKEEWTKYGPELGLPKVIINTLAQTADGTIWAGSLDEGLYYLQGARFSALRMNAGLSDDAIVALFVDRQQNIWVGTRSAGLNRVSSRKISICHVLEDGSERLPLSLAQTTDGELWVGASGRGIYHLKGSGFEQLLHEPPMSGHLFIGAMLGARDGSLWWGAGPAVFQWKNGAMLTSHDREPWLRGDRVLCLCENQGGGVWVGTYNGQLRLVQQGQSQAINGLSGKPVAALVQETNGTLWIGSMGGGLARLQDGNLTTFTVRDGLRSDLVRTLHLDSDGTLWIGTVSGGLARWSRGRFATFTPKSGLIDETVLQILEDDQENLWLGCNRGICRVSKRALNDLADGKSGFIYPLVFGQPEGMISEQCEANFAAGLKTQSGRLCFSTAKGIAVINPREQTNSAPPPAVLLEDVLVDGSSEKGWFAPQDDPGGIKKETPRIPPGRRRFEFHYTGVSWSAPEKIRFRYRLEGLDLDWTEAGAQRVAIYNYVPPGDYRFQVIACNGNGLWNDTGATVSFAVMPHLWQTSWFVGLSILVALGLTGGAIRGLERRRYRARLKRLDQERAMERERARIARDLHDELGSSLARISMLSDLGQARDNSVEQLKARVGKISGFAIRTARSLDEIVWAVNLRNDSLRSLLEYLTQLANELFEDSGTHCRFEIPDELPGSPLPPEMRHNIFLVVKEALANALKHARAGEVLLRAQFLRQQIEISVQDSGTGFDPALIAAGASRSGLKNMRQRIESLGGEFVLQTAPGQGTSIRLSIPCPAGGGPPRPPARDSSAGEP
jgi:ligand-binding sensor domain-containing protein/signal transduction histidine kinase